jgi:hypothetical protein
VYRLPGLSHRAAEYVRDLALSEFADWNKPVGRPKALSVELALRLALIHLRRNLTYAELGEDAGIVASTAWEYVQLMTEFLAEVLGCGPEELPAAVDGKICLVDGTLVPTFHWRHRRDLYSGKHRRYGVNVAVVTDLHGRIAGRGRGYPGSRHDAWCFGQDGLGERLSGAGGVVADPGYQGCGLTTPIKKKPGLERSDAEKEFNTKIARIRVGVEWGVARLKNWRILATRYRGDLSRINTVIAAVTGLQMLNERFSERRLTFDRITRAQVSE